MAMHTLTLARRCRTGWQASGSLIGALSSSRSRLLFTDDRATRPGPTPPPRIAGASMALTADAKPSSPSPVYPGAGFSSLARPNEFVAAGSPVSSSSSSSSSDYTVVQDGTEKFVVAARVLEANQVLFSRVEGLVTGVKTRHSVQLSKERHLETGSDLALMNHSCEPNCQLEVVDTAEQPYLRVTVRAPRVQPNEALEIDYNAMEIDMTCPFDCQCGAVRCRGWVSGFSNLSRAEQEEYIDGGATGSPPLTGAVKTWAEEHGIACRDSQRSM
ncbi:unnamed protein product [Ectocarpus sp. CCAP 1310/34]|nr:unnamed protein product [Ectocarpus sp. CCAP 1310/34]